MRGRFPGVVGIRITFPFDQGFQSISDTRGIEDIVNFKVFLIVNVGGRWSGGKSVRRNGSGFDGVKE